MRHRQAVLLVILGVLVGSLLPATPAAAAKGRCDGKKAKIGGTTDADRLKGTKKNDVVVSGKGNDRVRSGKGHDRICSGPGKDRLKGGPGNDYIDGGKGKDRANGGPGADFCINVETQTGCENPVALHMDDHLGWESQSDEAEVTKTGGDTITTTLRIGNGIPGAQGYTRTDVAPAPFLTGTTTVFDYGSDTDDGSRTAMLPFPTPFFGVEYSALEVSTNGWAQFGAGAEEYSQWGGQVPSIQELADFYRGVFLYWHDLDHIAVEGGDNPGTIQMVVAPDGVSFAIQWIDIAHHDGPTPERDLQVVFFRDGRIRFDYPGPNVTGEEPVGVVALSGGNGPGTFSGVAHGTNNAPDTSILFTPNDVPRGAVPEGTATTSLPAGSSFVGADPGCALTTAPTATTDGLATCDVPALGAGQQALVNVQWSMPLSGEPFNTSASYASDGFTATDVEQTQDN